LQELPDPISKVVWDNVAAVSRKTADDLGVRDGSIVAVKIADQSAELPVLIQGGMADGVIATSLGYGRTLGGKILQQAGGVNVAPLLGRQSGATPRLATNAQVTKADGKHKLVRTQK